jgi:hypothetical protein
MSEASNITCEDVSREWRPYIITNTLNTGSGKKITVTGDKIMELKNEADSYLNNLAKTNESDYKRQLLNLNTINSYIFNGNLFERAERGINRTLETEKKKKLGDLDIKSLILYDYINHPSEYLNGNPNCDDDKLSQVQARINANKGGKTNRGGKTKNKRRKRRKTRRSK